MCMAQINKIHKDLNGLESRHLRQTRKLAGLFLKCQVSRTGDIRDTADKLVAARETCRTLPDSPMR